MKRTLWTRHDPGTMPCEGEGTPQGAARTGQRMPVISSEPPAARRQAWNRFSCSPQEEPTLLTPSSQTSGLQTETTHFSCSKPPSLWGFVTTALGNSCTYVAYVAMPQGSVMDPCSSLTLWRHPLPWLQTFYKPINSKCASSGLSPEL